MEIYKGGHEKKVKSLSEYKSEERKNKKAQVVSGIVVGIIGLVFLLILAYVFIDTLTGANLITDAAHSARVGNLTANFSEGVDEVSQRIPTLFIVAAVVLIVGALMFLWGFYQRMKLGTGGSSL